MPDDLHSLTTGFLHSAELHPQRPALQIGKIKLTYRELSTAAKALAAAIVGSLPADSPPLTAVFAYRSPTAYAGILGSLMAGHGYVPLNPTFPPQRTTAMLRRSECRSLIVDSVAQPQLDHMLSLMTEQMLVILPEYDDVARYTSRWPEHRFIGARQLHCESDSRPRQVWGSDIAYLLFTSGSTGVPKGVAVTHSNVLHFVRAAVDRYNISESDRFSQTFDLTFDLSVFDMFVAWERGACVCCPSRKELLNPAQFIRNAQLTVWFSVPSIGLLMKRLGSLKSGALPSLRWSLFCGEPLPAQLAIDWADAAPHSTLENLYGPTEATIACTAYRWQNSQSLSDCERDIVPIGYPLPGMTVRIVDDRLQDIPAGAEGELLIAGPQISPGYWRDATKTATSFVALPGESEIYYRTGDRVRQFNAETPLQFRGRSDHQIKVQGYRVELQEVEALLKQEAGLEIAIAVGWPVRSNGAGGVEAFITSARVDVDTIRARLKARLPRYAVPRKIHVIDSWPLNSNGKIDRGELLKLLEARV
ncbi:MAG TPA: amino acid adenylation domain-containing protein [Candidatus Binataceae bacterium]|nr:amino acid adenylation domain-containing protein [Candidatus Binataceae bacterium]